MNNTRFVIAAWFLCGFMAAISVDAAAARHHPEKRFTPTTSAVFVLLGPVTLALFVLAQATDPVGEWMEPKP